MHYDDEGYENGEEGSNDTVEGDDNDGDPPTDLKQPYAAPRGGTVGVHCEPNSEGGG